MMSPFLVDGISARFGVLMEPNLACAQECHWNPWSH